MPEKSSFDLLKNYLPEGAFEPTMQYIMKHQVQLTITRERATKLGDYKHAHVGRNHRISVNGNLNKYSFLVTLLHELAHLFVFERFGNKVSAHGLEWKNEFAGILSEFVRLNIFPHDLKRAIDKSIANPKASSCSDVQLLRSLKKYDAPSCQTLHVEDVADEDLFMIKGGRIFKKGEKQRTRYKCLELATRRYYLFHGLAEVMVVEQRN